MQHLTEEQLIAHYYHDGDTPSGREHLDSCEECRGQLETLRDVLSLVDQLPTPERSNAYGEEVWSKLRWKMGRTGLESPFPVQKSPTYLWKTISAIAAALAIAFVGGVLWHAHTQQLLPKPQMAVARTVTPAAATTAAAIESASKDRLLLVVVSDHLDSAERMLIELSNADATRSLDITSESKRAGELVASNRIYRQTAARRGETRIVSLLSDLEPVLVELSHARSTLTPDEIAALQKRIDSKGLLFKVRIVSAQVGGHEAPAKAPQKGTDSL